MHRPCVAAALLAAKLRLSRCEVRLWGPEGTQGRPKEAPVAVVRKPKDLVEDYIREGREA